MMIYVAMEVEIGGLAREERDFLSEKKPACPKNPGLRYAKFGDAIFAFPPSVKMFTSNRGIYGKGGTFEAKCGNTAANAQEFSELTIELNSLDLGEDEAKFPSLWLRSGFMSFLSPGWGGTFSNEVKLGGINPEKLDTYPHENGYYRIPTVKYGFLLVSSDPVLKLENGDPLTFRCETSGVPAGRMNCDFFFPITKYAGIRLFYINIKEGSVTELTALYTAVKRIANEWRVEPK